MLNHSRISASSTLLSVYKSSQDTKFSFFLSGLRNWIICLKGPQYSELFLNG